jgi:hypothetical protein
MTQVDDGPTEARAERVRVSEVAEAAPHLHEGLLDEVLREVAVPRQHEGQADRFRHMPNVEVTQAPGF